MDKEGFLPWLVLEMAFALKQRISHDRLARSKGNAMADRSAFFLDAATRIEVPAHHTPPIRHAVAAVHRDLGTVFGNQRGSDTPGVIEVVNQNRGDHDESYRVQLSDNGRRLVVTGGNDLGCVFGLYHLSEKLLGVDPFHWWTDNPPTAKQPVRLESYRYIPPTPRFRYRGWFTNDEDCFIGMSGGLGARVDIYQKVYEALLRSGQNTVIPGRSTRSPPQHALARGDGLVDRPASRRADGFAAVQQDVSRHQGGLPYPARPLRAALPLDHRLVPSSTTQR